MMKRTLYPIFILILIPVFITAQLSLTVGGYNTGFDSYEGTTGTIPFGITATSANFRGINTGSSTSGGAYSYSTTPGDNSLGGLHSGTNPTIIYEISFQNNTAALITSMQISYDFEQYRYNNTTGIEVSGGGALISEDLSGLSQDGSGSGVNGTVTVTPKSIVLNDLSIPNGAIFSVIFSWTDASGSDNGVAVDNFSISNVVLPVKLNSFAATNIENAVQLSWITDSEINNERFDILHSINGKTYDYIGYVDGNGNTTAASTYTFLHDEAFSGMNYYKLKQVDYDGNFEVFGPVAITLKKASKIEFYPSATKDVIQIVGDFADTPYTIFDLNGRSVQNGLLSNEISIANLESGLYFIHFDESTHTIIRL